MRCGWGFLSGVCLSHSFFIRTSILSVKPDTSAHAHLLDLVVFLSTKNNMERFTKDTNWAEFSAPLLEEAKERTPDPTLLADLLSKKKPPATNTGENELIGNCVVMTNRYLWSQGRCFAVCAMCR
jgi:hypothetical protein